MKDFYYVLLFLLVASLVFIFQKKVEHLTLQEVDDKTQTETDRLTKLEDEYSKLKTKLDSQEERMGVAASKAAEAQAFINNGSIY
jgi:hypothetical protein